MIRRLLQVRLRLVDAVAIAAIAVLGLKLATFAHAPAPAEQTSPFARVISHARSNYVVPDVTMTGAVPPKEEAKDAPAAGAPAKPKAQAPLAEGPGPAPSAAERALLERLGERRDELQQKNRDLELRERLLQNAEKKLESRINELKELETKTGQAGKHGPEAALRNLVTMYETMKPKDAAKIFDRLAHDVLVPVVLQTNPRKMSEILAAMSPEAAEKLTIALAARAKLAGADPSAVPPPPPLPPNELPAIEPATASAPAR